MEAGKSHTILVTGGGGGATKATPQKELSSFCDRQKCELESLQLIRMRLEDMLMRFGTLLPDHPNPPSKIQTDEPKGFLEQMNTTLNQIDNTIVRCSQLLTSLEEIC